MSFLINPFVYLAPGATLTADAGTFNLTGVNASFLRALRMQAAAGSFTLTGNDAGLFTGNPDLVAETGTFTLTGNAAALSRALRMAASAGTFSLTGNAAALNRRYALGANNGSFSLTGIANGLTYKDGSFSSVKLLCGFNGVDGATSSSDESGSPHALTFAGNAQLDTAQSKFGSASLLLDGTGDGVLADNTADWQFGSGQFTVEGFVRFNSVSSDVYLVALYDTTSQRSWALAKGPNSGANATWGFNNSTNGTGTTGNIVSSAIATSTGVWYHFAADRDASNVLRLYRDGTMIASGTFSGTYHASTGKLSLGGFTTSGAMAGFYLNGWMDEVRITKGVARYASDSGFTVPTAAYPRA